MSSPAALGPPPCPPSCPPGPGERRRTTARDPDLVGYGAALALMATVLIGSTFAIYRPAAELLWPFAGAAVAIGGALAAFGWSGTRRTR